MNEPLYTVDCPYCNAQIIVFRDDNAVTCRACGNTMRIIHSYEPGYERVKEELTMFRKIRRE